MSDRKIHYNKVLVTLGILVMGVGLLAGLNVLVTAIPSPGFILGVVDDWSNHHIAYRNEGTAADALAHGRFTEWYRRVNDPRYVMQQMRRNTRSRAMMSAPDFAARMNLLNSATVNSDVDGLSPLKPIRTVELTRDWNVDVGPIGVGPGEFPAKFSFNSAASATDIAVFNTSEAGTATSATIMGINNLYATPAVVFAYNIAGDTVATSVVFDLQGDQVAFVSTNGGKAYMNVLRFETAGGTTDGSAYASPATLTSQTTAALYTSCKAGTGTCLYRVAFAGSTTPTDTNSSPYYDYANDRLWVGDNSGDVHEFTGVFHGTVAESGSPWATSGATTTLTSPVSDGSYVYVGASNGKAYSFKISSPSTVATSPQLTSTQSGYIGLNDAPLLDASNGNLYFSLSSDNRSGSGDIRLPTPGLATWYAIDFGAFSGGNTSAETVPAYVGSFDNTYYTSAAGSNTGYITDCNIYSGGGLYFDPQKLSDFSTSDGYTTYTSNYIEVAGGNYVCSPQTEVFNGTDDYAFFSVAQDPSTTGGAAGDCTNTSGCIYSLVIGSATAFTWTGTMHSVNATYYAPENTTLTSAGGSTSGIIVDYTSTSSHIYYTTHGTGGTPGSPSCSTDTANCATQLTQSALD